MFIIRSLFLISLLCCSGCTSRDLVTTAAQTGVMVAQERTLSAGIDDKTIYLHLKKRYAEEDFGGLFVNVRVKVIEGKVHLTGHVTMPETRIDAIRIAWEPRGVQAVINEIKVTDKSAHASIAKDTWLRAQLRSTLLLARDVKSINYSFDIIGGTVYLMGIAQDMEERALVAAIASRMKGVKKVISYVRLKEEHAHDA